MRSCFRRWPGLESSRAALCAQRSSRKSDTRSTCTPSKADTLPGPVHAALELETSTLANVAGTGEYDGWHLGPFLRKYFGEKYRTTKGNFSDKLVSCPTALSLANNNLANTTQIGTIYRTFTYSLNNWKKDSSSTGTPPFGTDPPWYFGYPDWRWQNAPAPFKPLDPSGLSGIGLDNWKYSFPKRLLVINQPSREWAIADAFTYWVDTPTTQAHPIVNPPGSGRKDGPWQWGTYMLWTWASKPQVNLPKKLYHSDGINQLCFDGHVEWQRPWKGTINYK